MCSNQNHTAETSNSNETDGSLEQRKLSIQNEFLQKLKLEIEEANREALSDTSDASKSKTSSSLQNDSFHFSSSIEEESFQYNETSSNENLKPSNHSLNMSPLSESWLNTSIKLPSTQLTKQYARQDRKKSPDICDGKIKISIPLDPYLKTPLNKEPNLTKCYSENKENFLINNNNYQLSDSLHEQEIETIHINNVKFQILFLLGEGGTSKVYNCIDLLTRCERALKKIDIHTNLTNYMKEINVLKQLSDCDHVVQMYDYEIRDNYLYIIIERGYQNLSVILKEYFHSHDNLPFYILVYYWMEMLNAVKQVHDKGIIHMDLKPSNFIQCSNCIKLIDFGTAIAINKNNFAIKTIQEGSPHYVCPESLINRAKKNCDSSNSNGNIYKVSLKSDVWSLGCILYYMVYKKTPFHQFTKLDDKLKAIINSQHKIEFPEVNSRRNFLIKVMTKCLVHDMYMRPSVDDLINYFKLDS